jgi:geranylgeranyl diphosphate synthase type II
MRTATMSDFTRRLEDYVRLIEGAMASYLPATDTPQGVVAEAMEYSAMGGGKRIRGALLLAVYEACNGEGGAARVLPFACAVEMVHAYSLIHDDLPCMDDDDMRRGKPACHIAFGEDIALLAGDALLTLAFELMTGPEAAAAAEKALSAANLLARAIGSEGMVGGQVLDLKLEGQAAGADFLRLMDGMKTGDLIAAAAEIGCVLSGAGAEARMRLTAYAKAMGLAFQVVDDILDVTSSDAALGKPVGSDKENAKSTYAGLLGLDGARALADELSKKALAELKAVKLGDSFLADMAEYLLKRDH